MTVQFDDVALKASKAKVVSFAMQGHGAQEDYDFITKVSEVLIENHGFNRLIFLSSYIDCNYHELNEELPIFKLYAKSKSFQYLAEVFKANSGKIDGIDIPMGGEAAVDAFRALADSLLPIVPMLIKENFNIFVSVGTKSLRMNDEHVSEEEIVKFYFVVGWLQKYLKKNIEYENLIILSNVVARVRMLDQKNSRSSDIENNFLHILSNSEPNDKFVVIGHATHLLPVFGSAFFPLRKELGDQLYTILTSAAFGEVTDYKDLSAYSVAMPNKESIEFSLVRDDLSEAVFYSDTITDYLKSKGRVDLTVRTRNYSRLNSILDLMVLRKQCNALYLSGKVSPVRLA